MLYELIWAYYTNLIHHFSQYFCSYNFLLPFFFDAMTVFFCLMVEIKIRG